MSYGKFITFEGGEGSGKSTQIRRLAERLEAAGHKVVLTREPGGTQGGEEIRNLILNGAVDRWSPTSEALLMYAARRDHVERIIRPALLEGAIVLCDRFADSTRVYQGAAGNVEPELIEALETYIVGHDQPHLTLILDIPVEDGLARAGARAGGEERFESKGLNFHNMVRKTYRDIALANPQRCELIDASGAPDEVAAAIDAALSERLGL